MSLRCRAFQDWAESKVAKQQGGQHQLGVYRIRTHRLYKNIPLEEIEDGSMTTPTCAKSLLPLQCGSTGNDSWTNRRAAVPLPPPVAVSLPPGGLVVSCKVLADGNAQAVVPSSACNADLVQ